MCVPTNTLTGHFGSWEVAARHLSGLGRPVNMVVAHEPNPSVRDFMHAIRTRHGFRVIRGQQEAALDAAVFAAPPHKLQGPVKTPFGFYIFQVQKITPATQQSLSQAKLTIQQRHVWFGQSQPAVLVD